MSAIRYGFAASAVLAGVAIGLAGSASAEHVIMRPDYTTLNAGEWTVDTRLQGNTWTGTTSEVLTLTYDNFCGSPKSLSSCLTHN